MLQVPGGQLYAVAEASKSETGGGEGVEVLVNEPYEKTDRRDSTPTRSTTCRVPGIVRALALKELWRFMRKPGTHIPTAEPNAYMKDAFMIKIETWHKPDMGGRRTFMNWRKAHGTKLRSFILTSLIEAASVQR
ncbi:hypothetical protein INR49_032720 [Caranx melampygus]|nr:hypothetical protein INR49_032720 [Caranx melampygus]